MQRKSGKSILLLVISLTALSCSSQKAPPADQPLTDCELTMSSELGLTAVDDALCGFVDERMLNPTTPCTDKLGQSATGSTKNPFFWRAISHSSPE